MAKKIAKHSTEKLHHTKLANLYPDLFFFREEPTPYALIERLMQEWRTEWLPKPRSLRIRQFFNEKGISSKYLYQWVEKYPEVKETYDFVLDALADKRDIGATLKDGELNGEQVRHTFWRYEQGEKDFIAWKAGLTKKEEGAGQGNIMVVLEQFPESRLVPKKKVDE
jgi:hypothetical protein